MDITPAILEGKHLRLEPMSEAHLVGLWEAARHPQIWTWFPFHVNCADDVATLLSRARSMQAESSGLSFVQVWKESGQIIGSTSFLAAEPRYRRLEIGATWLTPSFQRTVANTESKLLMLMHAFEVLGCNRVEFKTDSRNTKSRAALARIGAVEEGTLRAHMINPDGSRRDSVYFSILRSEWPDIREQLLDRLN